MNTNIKKAGKEGKLSRCVKAPIRILSKARDFYVKNMSDCASNYGSYSSFGAMGCPTPHVATSLPKSFSSRSSASSSDDDLADLVRAASTRSIGKQSPAGGVSVVPRSHTVAIGRIDEEKPCDFGEDVELKMVVFPRSRSHAVTNKRAL